MGRDKNRVAGMGSILRCIFDLFCTMGVIFGPVWFTGLLGVVGLIIFSNWLEGLYIALFAFIFHTYATWNSVYLFYFVLFIIVYMLAQMIRKNIYR